MTRVLLFDVGLILAALAIATLVGLALGAWLSAS
jgi:hypothetical protein